MSDYTDQSLAAVTGFLDRFLLRPHHADQAGIKVELLWQFGLLRCIKYIDGTHIILSQVPCQTQRVRGANRPVEVAQTVNEDRQVLTKLVEKEQGKIWVRKEGVK